MAYTATNSIQTLRSLWSDQTHTQEAKSLLVLREEVEVAVRGLKAGKSPGVDNIPSELLKNGGAATTAVLTAIMPKDLGDEEMVEGVDTLTCHTFTKERQPQAMSELSYHQPNQPSQQDHARSYPQATPGQG